MGRRHDERDRGELDRQPLRPLRRALPLVLGGVVALVVRLFVVQLFFIPSPSMASTLVEGDRVAVLKVDRDPGRGDVVVFDRPPGTEGEIDVLIKRVVGLAGESVEGRDGRVLIDGRPIDEAYLDQTTTDDFAPVMVGEGQLFVMGDNRSNSVDSRVFGPIDTDSLVGTAVARVWPPDHVGGL